ncbi:hypothetical protein ASPCAL04689 [Aspergillus calidoustus]|uniref:DUF7702 domain-containing protein n=1 Tax=Aspergillus calidoustus TaxID=454130 RepID=A0A0U5G236_ASPCI|nr:hypothetical protein ASPCAL04689 [Aspergillus calidoustus]
MPLTPHQSLSLTLLILYTPALYPTLLLLHRHSLGHAWGWLYLFIFTILRILGAALQFASGYTHDEDSGLRVAARILASIGVMTLLLGMLEGVEVLKSSLPNDPIPPRLWTLLHLSQYEAFILSIIFTATGQEDLSYASAIVVACLFVVLVGIVSVFYFELRRAPAVSTQSSTSSSEPEEDDDNPTMKEPSTGEDTRKPPPPILSKRKTTTLLHILLVSIPFLAVRVIYMLLATFTHDSMFTGREPDDNETTESWTTATEMETYILPNVYLVAFMQYAVEIVVFGLFVGAGFVVPASRRG